MRAAPAPRCAKTAAVQGTHRGTHATSIPGIPGTSDSRFQAVSACLQGCRWAHLGSNQGPLACEASALPLSYAPEKVSG